MEKYLTPQLPPVSIIPEHKKYRRDSASVVDQFFTDSEGLPYSINMNVFLPDITHLRTGLYKSQRPCVTHIKTEPVTIFSHQSETTAPPPAPTQALPESPAYSAPTRPQLQRWTTFSSNKNFLHQTFILLSLPSRAICSSSWKRQMEICPVYQADSSNGHS